MTKRILIYGGSFSPPTIGHIQYVTKLSEKLDELNYDEIWVMPTNSEYDKKLVSFNTRLDMCIMVFSEINKCIVSAHDSDYQTPTIKLISKLRTLYPEHYFGFTCGVDCANSIHIWDEYEKLIAETEFIIVSRKGYKVNKDTWYKYIELDIPEISSSEFNRLHQLNSSKILDMIKYSIFHKYYMNYVS